MAYELLSSPEERSNELRELLRFLLKCTPLILNCPAVDEYCLLSVVKVLIVEVGASLAVKKKVLAVSAWRVCADELK